jgi:hypothetical protein
MGYLSLRGGRGKLRVPFYRGCHPGILCIISQKRDVLRSPRNKKRDVELPCTKMQGTIHTNTPPTVGFYNWCAFAAEPRLNPASRVDTFCHSKWAHMPLSRGQWLYKRQWVRKFQYKCASRHTAYPL